jgi:hypothetical protein
MANIPKTSVKYEYATWLATPARLKTSFNLPRTKRDFAHLKGVNPRTLSRWEAQEPFQELVRQRRIEVSHSAPNSTVTSIGGPRPATHKNALRKFETPPAVVESDDPVWDETLSEDEQRYQQVKDTLVRMAMDGNQGAIDMYMKHYGKPFIDAEQKSGNLFPNMSDGELASEVCRLLGMDVMTDWMSKQVVSA